MLIFIDTEFTNLQNPQLISIGLAAATGETFYAEVPYRHEQCSDFVKEVVIPLIGASPTTDFCSVDELCVRLSTWFFIVKHQHAIEVCFDSEFDWQLFSQIFDNKPPAFCRKRNINYEVSELLRYEFHQKYERPEHHALNDAEALRYAFRQRILG